METTEYKKITINDLPETSRVWVYQANRVLTEKECTFVNHNMQRFIEQWAAHGKQLFGTFQLFYQRFLVVAVDESKAGASGCSIDASVRFITELGNNIQADFFDRMNVVYLENNMLQELKLNDLSEAYQAGKINDSTIVFNNLIQSLGEFNQQWQVKLTDSWHQKFL